MNTPELSLPGRSMAAIAGLFVCAGVALGQGQITTVSPNSAMQGATGLTVTFTLADGTPPPPPAEAPVDSATIGAINGTSIAHVDEHTVTGTFDIPFSEAVGAKDAVVTFQPPMGGPLTFTGSAGFTVTAGADTPPTITSHPQSLTVAPGASVVFSVAASGSAPLQHLWRKDDSSLGGGTNATFSISSVAEDHAGSYHCVVSNAYGSVRSAAAVLTVDASAAQEEANCAVVDAGQDGCYDTGAVISAPAPGETFYGQDAQYAGNQPSYTVSADGLTVYDHATGLTWQRSPDTDDDGDIDADDKLSWTELQAWPATLNAADFGGYGDWRLPSIKELYSLIDFRGTDPNPQSGDSTGLVPFIDTNAFTFAYGDTAAGERVIDSQYASSNLYVAGDLLFGVNFADGRIKGYGLMPGGRDKTFLVACCRGATDYGTNRFVDNGDGTITDLATGLVWQQADGGHGMNWEDALAYAEDLELAGRRDWRLPNVKELQGLVDYTRSPDTSSSAAIDPLFTCTPITNMNGDMDYAFYWSGTTHLGFDGNGARACYVAFGRGLGTYDEGVTIEDVHGAGCQRSDPKTGDPADYPNAGNGPQGDVSRVFNHVRCVRAGTAETLIDTDGDGLADAWEYNYGANTTNMVATADGDGDGLSNEGERAAGTIPIDPASVLAILDASSSATGGVDLVWSSEPGRVYGIIRQWTDLAGDTFTEAVATGIQATPPWNTSTCDTGGAGAAFYRIGLE